MGDVLYNVQYSLDCEGAVKIDFTAMVSAPTPINLANHVYFNLAGHRAGTKGLNEHVMKMAVYRKHGGFCLETQKFPDSINQPSFPTCVVRPGDRYHHAVVYKFGK